MFSAPSMPSPPPAPVQAREDAATTAKNDAKKRLSKRKGGRQFLSSENGFKGIADTLLGTDVNNL
jgi:hypothetical protein